MKEHSLFPPSAMFRLIACPASWREEQSRPEVTSDAAAHGIMLHDVVPKAFTTGRHVVTELEERLDRRWVLECVEFLQMLVASCNGLAEVKFETQVNLSAFGLSDVWGTSDVILIDHHNKHVHVIDWKFGSGVPVYASDNAQLMTYAAGVVSSSVPYEDFSLHIVQPPLDIEDVYVTTATELKAFALEQIAPAIEAAKAKVPKYNPSKHACQFCKAKNECEARYAQTMEDAKTVFAAYKQIPMITTEQIQELLAILPRLKQAITDINKYVLKEMLNGRPIPSKKLVHGRASRKWIDKAVTARTLMERYHFTAEQIHTEPELKSPAQMEAEDKTLKNDKDFQALIHKEPGGLKVVDESDPRTAVIPEQRAAQVFSAFVKTDKPKKELL